MEASGHDPDVQAEAIARSLHAVYGKFSPDMGEETRRSRGIWEDESEEDRNLAIAVVKKLIVDGVIEPGQAVTNPN